MDYRDFFEGRQLEQIQATENEALMSKYIERLNEELLVESTNLNSMSHTQLICYIAQIKITLNETEMRLFTTTKTLQAMAELQNKLIETVNGMVGHKKSLSIATILNKFSLKK